MGRLQGEEGRRDSARTALIVGALAVALGGTALFGIVAHTWTPLLPQRGAGAGTFDPGARAASVETKAAELIPKHRMPSWVPFAPRPDEFQVAEAESTGTKPPEAKPVEAKPAELPGLTPAESVVEPSPPDIAVAAAPPASLAPEESVVLVEADLPAIRPVDSPVGEGAKVAVHRSVEAAPAVLATQRPGAEVVAAKPVQPPRVEARTAELIVVAAKGSASNPRRVEPKPVAVKHAGAKPLEAKPAAPRTVEAKRMETRPVALRVAAVRPAEIKGAEGRRAEAKRVAERKAQETKLADARRAAESKATQVKLAEAKRVADAKATQAKLAEAKRQADARAVQAKLAETKWVAEAVEAERKHAEAKLAETQHAAELAALEARLAESQRATETRAAEAKLAATRRAMETTLAEAKIVETRLAETKRALAESAPSLRPAVDTRSTRGLCDACGLVTSVKRFIDRGAMSWEVRVGFDGGGDRLFVYSADPGFYNRDRVRVEAGRLAHLYSNRTSTF